MAGDILVNKALEFLLDYGSLFLVLLLIYEGLKLVFGMSSKEELIGAKERAVGRGISWMFKKGAKSQIGQKIGESARGIGKSIGVVGADIDDVKKSLREQQSVMRTSIEGFNQVIIEFNNVMQSMEYTKSDIHFKLPEIYSELGRMKQDIQAMLGAEMREPRIMADIKEELQKTKNDLASIIEAEKDDAKKIQYNSLLEKINAVLADEIGVEDTEKKLRAELFGLYEKLEKYLTTINIWIQKTESGEELTVDDLKTFKNGTDNIIKTFIQPNIRRISGLIKNFKDKIEKIKF